GSVGLGGRGAMHHHYCVRERLGVLNALLRGMLMFAGPENIAAGVEANLLPPVPLQLDALLHWCLWTNSHSPLIMPTNSPSPIGSAINWH
ncbi:hypothetical protein PCANC_28156, partial [Puccinia coronata f. sp. avenae]